MMNAMGNRFLLTTSLLCALASAAIAQQAPTTRAAKANARPTPAPELKAEPFEKADVKTMAGQCVTLDTEAGAIELELFPESAPESVRNF